MIYKQKIISQYNKQLVSQRMNPLKQSEDISQNVCLTNDSTKQLRDLSPQANPHIPRPYNGKHANSIRPYRPKKHNTPSPLSHKDRSNDSKSRLDSKSLSRCDQNSRKQFDSCRPSKKKSSKQLEQIYNELLDLKSEYKSLKQSYNNLLKEKQQFSDQICQRSEEICHLTQENNRLKKQVDKIKNQLQFSQHELQRIKKQCFKLIQIENFKNKKLQETLQQKQLMIQYLRNQFGKENSQVSGNLSRNIFLQTTTPIFRSNQFELKGLDSMAKKANASISSLESIFPAGIIQNQRSKLLSSMSQNDKGRNISHLSDDSLSFSKDNNQKSIRNLESVIISPMKLSRPIKKDNDIEHLSYCTFELKEVQSEKSAYMNDKQKVFKKRLVIATDQNDKSQVIQKNVYCDEPSIDTKKKSEQSHRRRNKHHLQEKDITNRSSIQRRMGRIDVQIADTKARKSRVQVNMSCR